MDDNGRKKGGDNRSKNLSPERRKEIASAAAKARHDKRRQAKEAADLAESISNGPPHIEPAPPVQEPQRRVKGDPVPKVFGRALAEAEKQLSKHLEEISFHENMLAMKKARLPFLVQTIKALGGTINPEQVAGSMDPYMTAMVRGEQFVPVQVPTPQNGAEVNLPPVPRAHGGALGVIDDPQIQKDDENQFLREGDSGPWR